MNLWQFASFAQPQNAQFPATQSILVSRDSFGQRFKPSDAVEPVELPTDLTRDRLPASRSRSSGDRLGSGARCAMAREQKSSELNPKCLCAVNKINQEGLEVKV
jgi:hypothetical protein